NLVASPESCIGRPPEHHDEPVTTCDWLDRHDDPWPMVTVESVRAISLVAWIRDRLRPIEDALVRTLRLWGDPRNKDSAFAVDVPVGGVSREFALRVGQWSFLDTLRQRGSARLRRDEFAKLPPEILRGIRLVRGSSSRAEADAEYELDSAVR